MTIDLKKSAQGYRVPKRDFRRMLLSIVTLGFKAKKPITEEAKTYEYSLNERTLQIAEVVRGEKSKVIGQKSLRSTHQWESIVSRGRFEEGDYIYYIDRETPR